MMFNKLTRRLFRPARLWMLPLHGLEISRDAEISEQTFLRLSREHAYNGDIRSALAVLLQGSHRLPKSLKIAVAGIKLARKARSWLDAIEFGRSHWTRLPDTAVSILLECYVRSGAYMEARRFVDAIEARRAQEEQNGERLKVIRDFPEVSRELRTRLKVLDGKHCVVFGSAPDPSFGPRIPADEPIICCNGSAYTLEKSFGLQAEISFVHSHVLARDTESDNEARKAFEAVNDPGTLVILTEERHPHNRVGAFELDWSSRFFFLSALIGVSAPVLNISTGAFAVIAAFFSGARSVRLVGFSFTSKGHSYNTEQRYRNHVSSDAAVYAMLTECGYLITSESPDISAIVTRKLD